MSFTDSTPVPPTPEHPEPPTRADRAMEALDETGRVAVGLTMVDGLAVLLRAYLAPLILGGGGDNVLRFVDTMSPGMLATELVGVVLVMAVGLARVVSLPSAAERDRQRAAREAGSPVPVFAAPVLSRARHQLNTAPAEVYGAPIIGAARVRAALGWSPPTEETAPLRVAQALEGIDRLLIERWQRPALRRGAASGAAPDSDELVEVFRELFHRVNLVGAALHRTGLSSHDADELVAAGAAVPAPLEQLGDVLASSTEWTVRLLDHVELVGQALLDHDQREAVRDHQAHLSAACSAPPVVATRRLEELQHGIEARAEVEHRARAERLTSNLGAAADPGVPPAPVVSG